MTSKDWDAALVLRANELLAEVRRYHVDAEATRLQMASAATAMTRKVDELPGHIRRSLEESLEQDAFNAERPILAKRLEVSSRMLNDLATQLHASGSSFLRYAKRTASLILVAGMVGGAVTATWAARNYSEAARLSAEATALQRTVNELEKAGGRADIKACIDNVGRSRVCVRVDESAGKFQQSFYAIAR